MTPAPMVAPDTSMAASTSGRGIGFAKPSAPQITVATTEPESHAAGMPRTSKHQPPSAATAI